MRPSCPLAYLRPPKPRPLRSPFTRPTTYAPPTSSTNRQLGKQTDLNHLVHHAIPAAALGTSSRPAPGVAKEFYFVHFKDRIKFWNLTAGDRVIIAESTKQFRGKIGTIYWVDRTTNRLGLLEPEFWKDEKQKPHPDMPKINQSTPIEFEYGTVRLMAPGSDEMYYEDLREVEHEAVPTHSGGRRKELHWTRIGTRHSIRRRGPQSAGEEVIPWPVAPNWPLGVQDGARRLELREAHMRRMEAEWAHEMRRRAGEEPDVRSLPASHVQSREMRKDLFASPREAWANTLDPSEYEDSALWLAASPLVRARFADYFSAGPGACALPELGVADWELSAGRHTRRAKTALWEARLALKTAEQIDKDVARIVHHLNLDPAVVRPVLETAAYRQSMVRSPDSKSPSDKQIKQAQMQRKIWNDKVEKRERLAALDLLPALELFNSSIQTGNQDNTS